MIKRITCALLSGLTCLLWSCSSPSVTYRNLEVNAPFAMEPIRVAVFPANDFPITDYGAVRGRDVKSSQAIAQAIDACHAAGGGRVIIPEGDWLSGAIHLKSNVNLHLEEGANLYFSDDPYDYLPEVLTCWEGLECYNYSPLIYALECENIAVTGSGTLKPLMTMWQTWFPRTESHLQALAQLYHRMSTGASVGQRRMAGVENRLRPQLIHFNRCKNVQLERFSIRESPFWTIHLYMCEGGWVRNLDIRTRGANSDGIDLEKSRNFLVEECSFDLGNDAVVIKSGRNQDGWKTDMPSENIVVRHCTVYSGHSLLAIGSELSGGVRNVYMHDCKAPRILPRFFFIKTNHRRGGYVENIYLENVESGTTRRVLEIDTDVLYQWRDLVPTYETRITRIEGIHLKNVKCDSADAIFELKGDPREPIRHVNLENIHVKEVNQFISRVSHTEGLTEKNITFEELKN